MLQQTYLTERSSWHSLTLYPLAGGAAKPQSKRAAHKFQKKPPRSKGNRGLADHQDGTEGSSLHVGRRGGLVRVSS